MDGQRPKAVRGSDDADGGGMEVEVGRYCCGSTVRAAPVSLRARQGLTD